MIVPSFYSLAITISTVLFMLLALVIAGLLIAFAAAKISQQRSSANTGKRWALYLEHFNRLCNANTRLAEKWLIQLVQKNKTGLEEDILQEIEMREIQQLNVKKISAQFQQQGEKTKSFKVLLFLNNIAERLCFYGSSLKKVRASVAAEHNQLLQHYYDVAFEISKLHDELKEYVKGKSLTRQAGEWVNGFFDIFHQWFRNGAGKEPAVIKKELIEKIKTLNSIYPETPFVHKTNDCINRAEEVYTAISALYNTMATEVNGFASTSKMAAKATAIISRALQPGMQLEVSRGYLMHEQVEQPVFSKKINLFFIAAALFISLVAFAGGAYWHNNIASKTEPASAANAEIQGETNEENETNITSGMNKPVKKDSFIQPLFFALDTLKSISGLDISHYQGNLLKDYRRMDTLHFVICKATEGVSGIDPDFYTNWKALKKINIIRGAYHFYYTKHDPLLQAEHFVKTVGQLQTADIPLVLDIEEGSLNSNISKPVLQEHLLSFLDYIEKQTGKKPLLYTSYSFANSYLSAVAFASYPLWLAEYTGKKNPKIPAAWKNKGHAIWQKTDSFTIDSRKTDFDIFNGNGKAFKTFIFSGQTK